MSIIQICLLFLGLSFCITFATLSVGSFKRLSLKFFVLYLALEALNFGFEWLVVHPESPYKAAWLALMMASSFLMAPCVWLLAREIHQNSPPRLWPVAWGQVAVVVLGALFTLPLFLTANESSLLVDPAKPRTSYSLVIHSGMVAAVVVYLVQVPWYLRRCIHLFNEQVRLNKFLFSSISEPSLNTLRALIWVMIANWVLGIARTLMVMTGQSNQFWNLFFSACEVGVMLFALYAIFTCYWRHNLDDQNLAKSLSVDAGTDSDAKTLQKYAKSSLDKNTRARVLNKIMQQFEQNKIYRKSSLKLQDLCYVTSESAHYISQVINQDLDLNFYDLVNKYRIEEAQIKLKQSSQQTILEIALDVGFNSKSTFNKVFKELTGQIPSTYRSN